MSTQPDLPRLEAWRLVTDERDELAITGRVDGLLDGGLLGSTRELPSGIVTLRDGRRLRLGQPHPEVAAAPWAMPKGYLDRRLQRCRAVIARLAAGEGPTADEIAAAPLLETWCPQTGEGGRPVLFGEVTGHPRLMDGAMITTSPLLWLDEDRRLARTVSRWYRLGTALAEHIDRWQNQND